MGFGHRPSTAMQRKALQLGWEKGCVVEGETFTVKQEESDGWLGGECPCTYCKWLWIRASAKWLNVNVKTAGWCWTVLVYGRHGESWHCPEPPLEKGVNNFESLCFTYDNCVVVVFTVCRLSWPFRSTSASQSKMCLVNENVFRVLAKESDLTNWFSSLNIHDLQSWKTVT